LLGLSTLAMEIAILLGHSVTKFRDVCSDAKNCEGQ
jgi:hypothetical protein